MIADRHLDPAAVLGVVAALWARQTSARAVPADPLARLWLDQLADRLVGLAVRPTRDCSGAAG